MVTNYNDPNHVSKKSMDHEINGKNQILSLGTLMEPCILQLYRKNSKYWDMYVWANSLDSDQTALKEQSDQDLHCLPFFLHLLEALLHCKI